MQRGNRLGRSDVLRFTILVMVLMGTVLPIYAQQAGQWAGTTSQGRNVRFTVTPDGTLSGYGLTVLTACPSGAKSDSGFGISATIPIEDQRFTHELLADGALFGIVFSGMFTSDTTAQGRFKILDPLLRVDGEDIGSQLCGAEGTWEAMLQDSAGAEPASQQFAGRWTGMTSQERPMNFVVTPAEVISQYSIQVFQTCPSGAESISGFNRGTEAPIADRSFNDVSIEDGDIFGSILSGMFISDMDARGDFETLSPRLRVENGSISSQLCITDGTWTAVRELPGAFAEKGIAPPNSNGAVVYSTERNGNRLVTQRP